jgi:sodium/bile acid cotransporter 7
MLRRSRRQLLYCLPMAFIKKQLLPLGLIAAAIIGITLPAPGIFMAQLPTQVVAVTIIFLISGLLLRTDDIKAAVGAWPATIWGCCSILLITPIIGVAIAIVLPLDPALKLGVALFCCMPTTLSSGVALTTTARGNVAMALLLTVVTNLGGVFIVPFVVTAALGYVVETTSGIELSATDLLVKLCCVVLLPLAAGKALRCWLSNWVDVHRGGLAMASNIALISVPWMQFSKSSDQLTSLAMTDLLLLVLGSQLIHAAYLGINAGACRLLPIDGGERKAVILLASQKTLPVAVAVIAFLPLNANVKGLALISCVVFHLGQILVDATIASRWANE